NVILEGVSLSPGNSRQMRPPIIAQLGAGMASFVDFLQPFADDMSVDLSRRNVGMSQHHLHSPQVGAMLQQVRRKGMTQNVGRDVLADARLKCMFLEDLPKRLSRYCSAPGVEKQQLRSVLAAYRPQILPDRLTRSRPQRHHPLFAAFAEATHEA